MLTELPFQARHDGSGTQTGFAECAPGTFDSSCRVSQNFVKVPTRGEQGRVPSSFSFRELAPNITQTAQRAMWFCVGCPLCPFKTCYNFLAGQARGKSGFRSSGDAVHPHRGQKATLDSLDLTCPRNPLCVSTDSAIGATSIRSGKRRRKRSKSPHVRNCACSETERCEPSNLLLRPKAARKNQRKVPCGRGS